MLINWNRLGRSVPGASLRAWGTSSCRLARFGERRGASYVFARQKPGARKRLALTEFALTEVLTGFARESAAGRGGQAGLGRDERRPGGAVGLSLAKVLSRLGHETAPADIGRRDRGEPIGSARASP